MMKRKKERKLVLIKNGTEMRFKRYRVGRERGGRERERVGRCRRSESQEKERRIYEKTR